MIIEKFKKITKEKYKELISYFVFGISTTLVNLIIYQVLLKFNIDYKIANLWAVLLAKLYAYITNKNFVFHSKCNSIWEFIKEFLRFIYARGITGLIDYFGLIFFVECLKLDRVLMKYILQVIIIILNYVFSKTIVFKTKSGLKAGK